MNTRDTKSHEGKCVRWTCDFGIIEAMPSHSFQSDDQRLHAIKDKVLSCQRLNDDDALALYRTETFSAGRLAREHGARTDARR